MNRPIFGRAAAAVLMAVACARAHAAALALLVLALAAVPAAAATNTWVSARGLNAARHGHTATPLSSGKVLVAGGIGGNGSLASAELYDPATNAWSAAGNMLTARREHTATLLPSGKVLVTGGRDGANLAGAELYDPATNAWTAAGNMPVSRYGHTATLLPSGKVLVAGGYGGADRANVDLYDPATNTWSAASALIKARSYHTATLLPSGKVLVAGGRAGGGTLSASAEVYDPGTNLWRPAGIPIARSNHTATLLPSGQVLVAGGRQSSGTFGSAQLYDPATDAWTATNPLAIARHSHSATLLPSGKVLVAGGVDVGGGALGSAEVFDPATNSWSTVGALATVRSNHTATLLPSGQVLVAGGYDGAGNLASAESFDPATNTGSRTGNLVVPRYWPAGTLLPSGKVLVTGGRGNDGFTNSAVLYDPVTNTWSAAGNMATPRWQHTSTLLPSGKVLVAGGRNATGALASAELYDPATDTWSAAGNLFEARDLHTATLLPSGKVLVAAGGASFSAELYDPATNTWSRVAHLITFRSRHTATLLHSGKVLVTGGNNGTYLNKTELYDPATNTWTAAANLAQARNFHTATLLPSGKVLVAGGTNSNFLSSAEVYDPATDTWASAGSMAGTRLGHTATLLPSGKVLVAGGTNGVDLASTELYDPATNAWSAAGNMASAHYAATAALLPSGKVLVAGGLSNSAYVIRADLIDPGLAPVAALQPNLDAVSPFLLQNGPLVATSPGSAVVDNAATATGFMPWREGGGGGFNQSAGNAPVFQVQRIENDQMRFVSNDGSVAMTDTTFTGSASALAGFPAGPVLVRAWVNGVPSAARYSMLALRPGLPTAPNASGGVVQASVDFSAVADSGTSPVTRYTATASPGGATASCTAPCTSIVFSPLAAGDYTFTVHATSAVGDGAESPASNVASVTAMTPVLDWPAPVAIVYGTALDATQLNAAATYNGNPLPGTFAYTPAAGSVLPAGNAQALSVTFTPTDAAHYASAAASVLVDVTRAPLSVAGTSVQDKSYDGTAAAALVGGALVGVIAADAGNVALSQAGTFAQADVGTAIAVMANDAITGSAAGNYTLVQPAGLAADITPVTLTYTATSLTMPYGTTPGGLGGTVSGFVPGESLATATTGMLAFTTTATASSGVGQYPVTGSGLSANNGNYVFVQAAGNAAALTITAASTTTTLAPTSTTIVYGQNVTFAATVSLPGGSSGTAAGTVAFTENGNPLPGGCASAVAVSGGGATCTTSALSVATHHVVATFTPSDGNTTGSAGSVDLTVGKAATTTTLSAPAAAVYEESVTLTATVSLPGGNAGTVAGTVAFTENGNPLPGGCASAVTASGGTASCTTSALSVAKHHVAATFTPGDDNTTGSAGSADLTVGKAATTATITNTQPWTITFGATATVNVTVAADAPSSATPSGTIAVSDGDAGSGDHCTIVLPATSCTLTPSGAGSKTLSATFTPDAASIANVEGSSAAATLTVTRAAQAALNLVATPDVLIPGMASQLAASGGSGSGAVGYGVDSGPCSVSGSIATATGVGLCVVRATKAADANYDAADATATLAVQAAVPPTAHPRSVTIAFNTTRTIQLVGDDTNPGGPYAVAYAIVDAPVHGTLAGFDAASGALTYTPAVGYVGTDRFTFTVSSVNGVSQAATVSIVVASPQLVLSIEDGRDFARYGQVVDYAVTLANTGDAANAVPVQFTVSPGFDAQGANVTCTGATGGASCVQDASDPLRFTVTLPPNRSLAWLLAAEVRSDATGDTVTFGADATGAGSITDTNTLVVFRDGFDARDGAGTQVASVVAAEQARAILDADGWIDVVVPVSIDAIPTPLLVVRDAASEVRVEARSLAGAVLVRLFERNADGGERVSAWSTARPGATLTLASVAPEASSFGTATSPPRTLALIGAESALALP